MKKTVVLFVLYLFFVIPVEAQFLNRLKKSIQRGAEEAVLDKAEEETYKQTDNALNKMLEKKMKKFSNGDSIQFISKDQLPSGYDFSWNYQLTMNTDNSDFTMNFFLKEGEKYFASSVPESMEMYMVIDKELNAYITYLENDGQKMAMAMNMPEIEVEVEDSTLNASFTFQKTGNSKDIMGYTCEEFISENPDYKYIIYVTNETEISFGDIYGTNPEKLPAGFDPDWIKDGMGLMMEMEMTDKNKKKNNITTMTCTKLEKFDFTLNNDEYQFMN